MKEDWLSREWICARGSPARLRRTNVRTPSREELGLGLRGRRLGGRRERRGRVVQCDTNACRRQHGGRDHLSCVSDCDAHAATDERAAAMLRGRDLARWYVSGADGRDRGTLIGRSRAASSHHRHRMPGHRHVNFTTGRARHGSMVLRHRGARARGFPRRHRKVEHGNRSEQGDETTNHA